MPSPHLLTNCLTVFDHFGGLVLKGLTLSCMMLKNDQTQFENLAFKILKYVWPVFNIKHEMFKRNISFSYRDHSFSTCAKYSENLTFLPLDTHSHVCVSGGKKF